MSAGPGWYENVKNKCERWMANAKWKKKRNFIILVANKISDAQIKRMNVLSTSNLMGFSSLAQSDERFHINFFSLSLFHLLVAVAFVISFSFCSSFVTCGCGYCVWYDDYSAWQGTEMGWFHWSWRTEMVEKLEELEQLFHVAGAGIQCPSLLLKKKCLYSQIILTFLPHQILL